MEDLLSKFKNNKKITLFILAIFTLLGAKSSVFSQELEVIEDELVGGVVYDENQTTLTTDTSQDQVIPLTSPSEDLQEETDQTQQDFNPVINEGQVLVEDPDEASNWQTDSSFNRVSGVDPPTTYDETVYPVNWDRVNELNPADYVSVSDGQKVELQTAPEFTGQNKLQLTALVYDESGQVVSQRHINFDVSFGQSKNTQASRRQSGTGPRLVTNTTRTGVVNLNTFNPSPELEVKINDQPPTTGASINTGDKVDVRMSFKLPRHTLSDNNAQQLNYVTDIPLVEAVAAKPLVINDRVVGDYTVATSGEITLTISDEQFDYVNGLHSSGFAEYSGVASYVSDSTSDVNLGSSTNVIDLEGKNDPSVEVPKEYGIDVSKKSGVYDADIG